MMMCGRPIEGWLPPLEPDIVGEFFVLDHLRPKRGDTRLAEHLRSLAWQIDPFAMPRFLAQAVYDFPQHQTLQVLRSPPPPEYGVAAQLWSTAAAVMAADYAHAGKFDAARDVYDSLCELAADRWDLPLIRFAYVHGGVRLLIAFASSGDLKAAREIYEDLAEIADQFPDEPGLRAELARGARNLIILYSNEEDLSQAREIYDYIIQIVARHPEEPKLARSLPGARRK